MKVPRTEQHRALIAVPLILYLLSFVHSVFFSVILLFVRCENDIKIALYGFALKVSVSLRNVNRGRK